jgi:tripartite-type tricarboxylate transporter receptor subunit TctC
LAYDPIRDFSPVSLAGRFALLLVVHPEMPMRSAKELVDAAKREPKKINFAAPGPGSPIHLAMELFMQRTGAALTAIPYKGSGDAVNDVLGGRTPVIFLDIASGSPLVNSGKLRALAVASDKRVASMPDLPTIGESGYPGFEAWSWQGFVAPAGTPPEIIAKLNSEFARTMADPGIKQRLMQASVDPLTSSPEQFTAHMKSEIAKWATVIKDANISID